MSLRDVTFVLAVLGGILATPGLALSQTFTSIDGTGIAITCGKMGDTFQPGGLTAKGRFVTAEAQIKSLKRQIQKLAKGGRLPKKLKKAEAALKAWRAVMKRGTQVCLQGPPTPTPTATPIPPEPTQTPTPTPTPTSTPTLDPLRARAVDISIEEVRYLYEKSAFGAVPQGAVDASQAGGLPAVLDFMMKYDGSELDVLTECSKYLDNDYEKDATPAVNRNGIQKWALCLLMKSKNPFHDRLAFIFMHNLLAVSASGLQDSQLPLMREQLELMRAFAVQGSYHDLVKLHTRQGATLQYLNLAFSTAAQPNEDWARELMQLFTLGEFNPLQQAANGEAARNYNENDVANFALAAAGHGLQTVGTPAMWSPIIRSLNVSGAPVTLFAGTACEKTFERDKFRADPRDLDIIDHIFACKPVEDFLAYRLLREYLTEDLSGLIEEGTFVRAFAKRIRENNFDLHKSLKVLFASEVFWQTKYRNSIVVTPVEQVVTLARRTAMVVTPSHLEDIRNRLTQAAHTITTLPSVFGYDNMDFADAARQVQVTNLIRAMLGHSSFSGATQVWRCNRVLPQTEQSLKSDVVVEHLNVLLNADLSAAGKVEMKKFLDSSVSTNAQGQLVTASNLYDSKVAAHEQRLCSAIELLTLRNFTR